MDGGFCGERRAGGEDGSPQRFGGGGIFPSLAAIRSSETTSDVVLHRNPNGEHRKAVQINSSKDHATAMGWSGCCCCLGGIMLGVVHFLVSNEVVVPSNKKERRSKVHD